LTRRDPYRRYRRQMSRNYRSRHGGYPVIFSAPYEPIVLMALAALGRLAYRHRSAFLPFIIAGPVFVVAAVLHRDHPGAWPLITAVTVTVTFILGMPHRVMWPGQSGHMAAGLVTRLWEACGISRLAERVYAAVSIAAGGGWLAAATAIGPAVRPLRDIAGIATVILGIPWWAHYRRRARVRIERTVQAWPRMADNMGLPGSRIASAKGDTWGFTARLILRKGMTAAQAIGQIPAIESGLGIRPGSVRALPDPHRADRIILRVIETDPHAQPVPWPGQQPASINRPAEIGLFEDGRPVSIMLLRRNALIGGMMGSGKSGILNVILAFLAACADVTLWGIDLKGGMELHPWARCLQRLATTAQEATALFADAVAELDERAARMTVQGRRVWEPSADMPALVIVVDEYAELLPGAQEYADSVSRRGRAVAVNLLAATQRPTQEAMGNNAVRSQMDIRLCLRVRERRDVDLILGQGSFSAGWRADTLTEPGTFLISAQEHTVPERARAYLITDDQVAAHAASRARDAPARVSPSAAPRTPQDGPLAQALIDGRAGAEAALWEALSGAPSQGLPIRTLMAASGMGRSWVYYRLQDLAGAGHVFQASHGCWRAVPPPAEGDRG
jgi:S-DNA-T family DNA segregation ATPase FtsK/SpoIIIE